MVPGGSITPGNYRRIQNYVANSSTGKVIYTPPSAVEVPIMVSEMVKWLNSDLEIHPVLISGIAQFQLVHIHPFLDGKGRASRLLSTLCLYKAGYDLKRLFTISIWGHPLKGWSSKKTPLHAKIIEFFSLDL